MMGYFLLMIFLTAGFAIAGCLAEDASSNMSILGDNEMKNPDARFALEAWNSCNEVGVEAPNMGSPRMADCADLKCPNPNAEASSCNVTQRVQDSDNSLKAGDRFGNGTGHFNSTTDVDAYAVEKEKYLGSLCERNDNNVEWYFWKIMLKNGNLDTTKTICPENGRKVNKTVWPTEFPCFGDGCMNQPLMYRNASHVDSRNPSSPPSLTGGFFGSYDLDATASLDGTVEPNKSHFAVSWQKTNKVANKNSSWELSFKLTTSPNYPWLMLYLRADATIGTNGGYRHEGRGIMKASSLPQSPNFKVRLTLHVKKGGGRASQFYLSDIGSCWKNNGKPCDGDAATDVTRYSEMIINPSTGSSCTRENLGACPPYHINTTTGTYIYKNEPNFPFSAYHLYCAPGNAEHLEEPVNHCDPYTNPNAQELVQLLPHSEWAVYGYPSTNKKEEVGWESADPITWELDTGKLSEKLYFYQDPNVTEPAKRIWTSIHVGTEIYSLHSKDQTTAEWTVSDFDVVVTK